MKRSTQNKLKEEVARKQLKEGGCPQHTKGIGCTLKQIHRMVLMKRNKRNIRISFDNSQWRETKRTNNEHRPNLGLHQLFGTKRDKDQTFIETSMTSQ